MGIYQRYSRIVLSALLIAAVSPWCAFAGNWTYETIGTPGSYPNLALDSMNRPHVVYSYVSYHTAWLEYAYRDAGGWHLETVSTSGGGGRLALDAADSPRIIFSESNPPFDYGGVRYAWKQNGQWMKTLVMAAFPDLGTMALYAGDHPRFTFSLNDSLNYARYSGGSWSFETIATGPGVGAHYQGLSVDSNDHPTVAYWSGTVDSDVVVARKEAEWIREIADAEDAVGDFGVVMAVDRNGVPHLAYQSSLGLKYATRLDGGQWSSELVGGPVALACNPAGIAVDSSGSPHIIYINNSAGWEGLEYATKVGGVWERDTLNAFVGCVYGLGAPQIAVGSDGSIHVVYSVPYGGPYAQGTLMYATKSGGFVPLRLTDFRVARSGDFVDVIWQAADQASAVGYRIETTENFSSWLPASELIPARDSRNYSWKGKVGLAVSAVRLVAVLRSGELEELGRSPLVDIPRAGDGVAAVPNPFSRSTTLSIRGRGVPELIDVSILNVSGQRVRTIAPVTMASDAVTTTLAWDGRTDNGEEAGSGVYFIRLKSAIRNSVYRIVRVSR